MLIPGKNNILFIDEAQRIENIGLMIKPTTDHIEDVLVVTTPKSPYKPVKEAVNPYSKKCARHAITNGLQLH